MTDGAYLVEISPFRTSTTQHAAPMAPSNRSRDVAKIGSSVLRMPESSHLRLANADLRFVRASVSRCKSWKQEPKSVEILDKMICDTLSYADEVVDAKKDEAIEGIVSAKKVIHGFGPVQSAVVSTDGNPRRSRTP